MGVIVSWSRIKECEFYPCPTCKASYREKCRARKSGRTTDTHKARYDMTRRFHTSSQCDGEPCPIHRPSDHHMSAWPLYLRADLSPPIYERLCIRHGVGHPDPDSAAWAERVVREDTTGYWQADDSDGKYVWIHGCCGCCAQDMVAS